MAAYLRLMTLLKDKTALITGGSRGIGRGIVERFLEEGADVAFTYVSSPEKANALAIELAGEHGRKVLAIQSDAGDLGSAQTAVDRVVEAWGRLDILVNNAGSSQRGPIESVTRAGMVDDMDLKIFAAAELIRDVVPGMKERRWGRIMIK